MGRVLAWLPLLFALAAGAAERHQVRAPLDFSIRIPLVAQLALANHPPVVEANGDEIVVRGATLEVASNARGGAVVRVHIVDPEIVAAEVEGLPQILPRGRARYELTYRMRLASGAPRGPRAWPLRLSLEAP